MINILQGHQHLKVPTALRLCLGMSITGFLHSAAVKLTYALWVGRNWREQGATLPPDCARTHKITTHCICTAYVFPPDCVRAHKITTHCSLMAQEFPPDCARAHKITHCMCTVYVFSPDCARALTK
jgi:hypothetical protein